MSLFKSIKGFFKHHSKEVDVLGDALTILATNLPLQADDKVKVIAAAKSFKAAAVNVAAGADKLTAFEGDLPSAKELTKALKPTVKELVDAAVSSALEKMNAELAEAKSTISGLQHGSLSLTPAEPFVIEDPAAEPQA